MRRRLGIVGGGNMGGAIARGAIRARLLQPEEIVVADRDAGKRELLAALGCRVVADPGGLEADQLVVAVKPQQFAAAAAALAPVASGTVVISIMAGISSERIRTALGPGARIIRAMPNTPCTLGEGATGIALGAGAEPGDERFARALFEALGRTVIVEEPLMHAVTAVSGSGPAYVYLLAELMQAAAREAGLDGATARLLVVQTIIGAGRMLREAGLEPEELRRVVTTPNGTTAAALDVFGRRDLGGAVMEAILAARDRGATLDDESAASSPSS